MWQWCYRLRRRWHWHGLRRRGGARGILGRGPTDWTRGVQFKPLINAFGMEKVTTIWYGSNCLLWLVLWQAYGACGVVGLWKSSALPQCCLGEWFNCRTVEACFGKSGLVAQRKRKVWCWTIGSGKGLEPATNVTDQPNYEEDSWDSHTDDQPIFCTSWNSCKIVNYYVRTG